MRKKKEFDENIITDSIHDWMKRLNIRKLIHRHYAFIHSYYSLVLLINLRYNIKKYLNYLKNFKSMFILLLHLIKCLYFYFK